MTPPNPTRTALDAAGEALLAKIEHYVDCAVAYQDGATHHNDVENAKADVKASLASERAVLAQAKGATPALFCLWLRDYFASLTGKDELSAEQANVIRNKLTQMVFPPSALTAIEAFEKGEGK